MPNNTSSVYGRTDDELRRRPRNRQRVDLGIHVERDRARAAQGHLVVVRGLVGIDIHASAGVIRHPARHPRHAVDPGRRVAPIEISRRCRDLPQRIVLRDPVQEQGQRRPKADVTVLARIVGFTGLNPPVSSPICTSPAAVWTKTGPPLSPPAVPPSSGDVGTVSPKSLGLFGLTGRGIGPAGTAGCRPRTVRVRRRQTRWSCCAACCRSDCSNWCRFRSPHSRRRPAPSPAPGPGRRS